MNVLEAVSDKAKIALKKSIFSLTRSYIIAYK